MNKKRRGFTLIELIIVIVIIGILALVGIPRYFANIQKARKAEAVSTMRSIREAIQGYHASTNNWPAASTWPITVTIDGEDVMVVPQPKSANFVYTFALNDGTDKSITATAQGAGTVTYTMGIDSGTVAP